MATPRTLTADEVTFTLECEEEDIDVRGNALASGNDEEDTRCENEIIERLNNGDLWAWCTVKVTASWNGYEGVDCLGGCSYADEKDFTQPGGCYEDMKAEALASLNAEIARNWAKLETLTA